MNKSDRARLREYHDELAYTSENLRALIEELNEKVRNTEDYFPVRAEILEHEAGVIEIALIGIQASIEDLEELYG